MIKYNKKIYIAAVILLVFVIFVFIQLNQSEDTQKDTGEVIVFNPENSTIDELVMGEPIEDCNQELLAQGECTAEEALYVGCNDFL